MAAVDLTTNWLGLEPLLLARLQSEVTAIAELGGPAAFSRFLLSGDDEYAPEYPAVFVLYAGDEAMDGRANSPSGALLTQRWDVVICTKADMDGGETGEMAIPGGILSAVTESLKGWTPDGAAKPIERAFDEDNDVTHADGISYFVLPYRAAFRYRLCA